VEIIRGQLVTELTLNDPAPKPSAGLTDLYAEPHRIFTALELMRRGIIATEKDIKALPRPLALPGRREPLGWEGRTVLAAIGAAVFLPRQPGVCACCGQNTPSDTDTSAAAA
jgi:hypothetical protein